MLIKGQIKMKKQLPSICSVLLGLLLIGLVSGQSNLEANENSLDSAKYKIAFSSEAEDVILRLVVEQKFQTEENLVFIAEEIKLKYGNSKRIHFLVFDNKEDARKFEVHMVDRMPETLRARYKLDREDCVEELFWVRWIDGKPIESSIEMRRSAP